MAIAEADYRRLLEQAQEALETIEELLAALREAPRASSDIRSRTARISENLRSLNNELDQLWDEFKRM
jgi:phage-related minor tail protein